jgi:hypothetical protein
VTLHPGGTRVPDASNLNYVPGQVVPNAFVVGLGSGTFSDGSTFTQAYQIYASTTVDEIVDISGYFASSAGGRIECVVGRCRQGRNQYGTG